MSALKYNQLFKNIFHSKCSQMFFRASVMRIMTNEGPQQILLSNHSCSIPRKDSFRTFYHSTVNLQENSEKKDPENIEKPGRLKKTGQLAKVFAEYGTTAVVFHTTISLTSLGISYAAVSSGIDVVALLQYFNLISEATTEAKIAGGAGTFVIAYACHKVFMPVRIFLTVTCTPIIVRRLRAMGFLKNVKKPTA